MDQIPSIPTLSSEKVKVPEEQVLYPKPGRPRKREAKQKDKVEILGSVIKIISPKNEKMSSETLTDKNSKNNLLD